MIAWAEYHIGEHRIQCPYCGRGGGDKTAGLTIERDGKGVFHCFRCDYAESHRSEHGALRRVPVIKAVQKPQRQKFESLSAWGQEIWRDCRPLSGVAIQYLRNRHCVIPPEDGHLRFHPAMLHPSGFVGPALVALITDVLTNEPLSLHRTWVTPTGKANLETPRLLLRDHSTKGGCIRLWPDEAVTYGLGIAEGIETALSLAWAHAPVWATIDAGHMSLFPVLAGIETIVVARDQDSAGISAASLCAHRWAEAGKEVLVTRQAANDLNDVLREAA